MQPQHHAPDGHGVKMLASGWIGVSWLDWTECIGSRLVGAMGMFLGAGQAGPHQHMVGLLNLINVMIRCVDTVICISIIYLGIQQAYISPYIKLLVYYYTSILTLVYFCSSIICMLKILQIGH